MVSSRYDRLRRLISEPRADTLLCDTAPARRMLLARRAALSRAVSFCGGLPPGPGRCTLASDLFESDPEETSNAAPSIGTSRYAHHLLQVGATHFDAGSKQ